MKQYRIINIDFPRTNPLLFVYYYGNDEIIGITDDNNRLDKSFYFVIIFTLYYFSENKDKYLFIEDNKYEYIYVIDKKLILLNLDTSFLKKDLIRFIKYHLIKEKLYGEI